jgi:hypothetical protein
MLTKDKGRKRLDLHRVRIGDNQDERKRMTVTTRSVETRAKQRRWKAAKAAKLMNPNSLVQEQTDKTVNL